MGIQNNKEEISTLYENSFTINYFIVHIYCLMCKNKRFTDDDINSLCSKELTLNIFKEKFNPYRSNYNCMDIYLTFVNK